MRCGKGDGNTMKIGFLGAGNMAGAIVRGMVAGGTRGADICVYDLDQTKTLSLFEDCGVCVCGDAQQLARESDVLVLAIKPQVFAAALPPLRGILNERRPMVISIAAGKSLASIAALIGDGLPLVRVMPNIAAKVGEAVTAYCANDLVTAGQLETVCRIFQSVGTTVPLAEEQFGIFSVLASCSPAYTLMYMDALAQAGVVNGIPKSTALTIVAQAVLGTARLMQETGEHPRVLMDSVCSPAGTTVEGVCALQQGGFEKTVLSAAQASLEKDKKLQM